MQHNPNPAKEVVIMKKLKIVVSYVVGVVLLGFMVNMFDGLAAQQSREKKVEQKAIGKKVAKSPGIPVLKGDLWQKKAHDEKPALIPDSGYVGSTELSLMEKYAELEGDSFSAKVVEGMDNILLNEVIARVDSTGNALGTGSSASVSGASGNSLGAANRQNGNSAAPGTYSTSAGNLSAPKGGGLAPTGPVTLPNKLVSDNNPIVDPGSGGDVGGNVVPIPRPALLDNIGNDDVIVSSLAATPVPEPSTILLFGIGIAGFAGARMKRKKK